MRPALSKLALWIALLLAVPLRASREEARILVRSLADDVAVAELIGPWTLLRFGTPAAAPFEEEGLELPVDRRGETWVDARRRSELRLLFDDVRPRVALLDAAPYPGVLPQKGRVLFNGRRVARLNLHPDRRRYRIELPVERQLRGENRLALIFAASSSQRGPAHHRYAARLFGLTIGEPSRALDELEAGAPPFSFWPQGRSIVQAGPSTVRYALRSGAAGLRFRPALHSWTRTHGVPVRLRVAVLEPGGERELWRGVLDPGRGEGDQTVVALPGGLDPPRELALSIDTPDGRPAWILWQDLELVGSHAEPPSPNGLNRLRRALQATNVVLVVLDAAGARHFGCYGHQRPTTPEIDRIASEGVLFERAYTPAPFTLSAMASLWTSRLPDEHHRGVSYDDRLPEGLPTLAELLGAHGVPTAGFVGNGMAGAGFGLNRGFEEFAYVGYRARDFRAVLPGWLARRDGRPFFLYVHYREPHFPYDPPSPFDTLFGPDAPIERDRVEGWLQSVNRREHRPTREELEHFERLYDGNLATADHEIGWLRSQLEARGLWERTVVIVTADHGEELYEHGFIGHNEPVYEETIHVPLVVRFPAGAGPRGKRVGTLVDLLDVAPTVLDVLGFDSASTTFRGRSLLPVALGAAGRGELLVRSPGPRPRYTLLDGTTRFIFSSRYGTEELYDLSRDPSEQDDLVAVEPLRAAVYRQRLHRILLDLPGRWAGAPSVWQVPPDERKNLRTLGYVN